MRSVQLFLTFLLLLFTYLIVGQTFKYDGYSNSRIALLIDSLENVPNDDPLLDINITFDLAQLYHKIDKDRSKYMAQKFLQFDIVQDSTDVATIYLLLSSLYNDQNKTDSALIYLRLYDEVTVSTYRNEISDIREDYINKDISKGKLKNVLGVPFWFWIILTLLLLVSFTGYFFYISNLRKFAKIESEKNTELEKANVKLQEFNNNLQEAIMERSYLKALEFEEKNNEIINIKKSLKKDEEANYLKNAFLGSMSHQIRTPLSGIMGFSDMLETELALRGNEELFEFAKNIQESGDKLMSLITNIIDISSIEANLLELKPDNFDLCNLLDNLSKDYVFKARDKGIIFKTKYSDKILNCYADSTNVLKVLKVVVDNAIQYTNKGFVTISTSKSSSGFVRLEVNDTGTGIDDKTLNLLLDSFDYSKTGSSFNYEGNGLGLVLAHRLITLMNGNLTIKTTLDKGTTVILEIPSDKEKLVTTGEDDATDEKVSIVSAPELGRLSIFIIEDDRMNRMVLEKMLKKAGRIYLAVDGDDAIRKIDDLSKKNNRIDVVLMDINLPSPWDGLKLMQEIRKKYAWTKQIPFIAQTAYAMAGDKDMYLDAGFDDYISKPINKNELLTMIEKQLAVTSIKS